MKITLANPWFRLTRHDEPPVPPVDTPPVPPVEPPVTGDTDWEAESAKWKALSRKNEDRARDNAAAAQELADIKAAQLTETEKLTTAKEAAEQRAAKATDRAVKAEVKALADGFADRDDAALNLGDLTAYVTDGDVDTEAIKTALADVLTRKPHLAAVAQTRNPAPDLSQGRGGTNGPTNFRDAPDAEYAAEAAKYGIRPRHR